MVKVLQTEHTRKINSQKRVAGRLKTNLLMNTTIYANIIILDILIMKIPGLNIEHR